MTSRHALTIMFGFLAVLAGCAGPYYANNPPHWRYADCYEALQRGVTSYYEGREGREACDRMKADNLAWQQAT